MLRHAIFVLVLVGAAFAGGAAINGPGMAWLQHNLIGGPTIIVDGATPSGSAGSAPKKFPAANPPLVVDFAPHAAAPQGANPTTAPAATATLPPGDLPSGSSAGPDPALAANPPAAAIAPAQPAAPEGDSSLAPPLDLPPDTVAAATIPASTPAPAAPVAKADPIARLTSAGGLDPGAAPAATGATRDWTEIRQRLKALGVSRYAIDAETEGRVRFTCVIPVDGLRAVGHHFEADGDDEFQAVEAAIRRVTLWRATEPARSEP